MDTIIKIKTVVLKIVVKIKVVLKLVVKIKVVLKLIIEVKIKRIFRGLKFQSTQV